MNAKGRRTSDYLKHMLDTIARNEDYIGQVDRDAYPDFVAAHPEAPWAQSYRMGNALSHGYADIDLETVWFAVRSDLPPLRIQLVPLLA